MNTTTNLHRATCKNCNAMTRLPEGMAIDFQAIVPMVTSAEWLKNRFGKAEYIKCQCGKYLRGVIINAKHSDKIVCNEKCQSATRPVCECSCDGENHGA